MKQLCIIRHAQAGYPIDGDDFDRTLTQKGQSDALKLGEFLSKQKVFPDCIIASPAQRTMQTAQIIADQLNYQNTIQQNQYIYEAYPQTLEEIIRYTQDNNETLFLIGHNPAISALAYLLANEKYQLPPCGIIHITFDTLSWANIHKDNANTIFFHYPDMIQ